DWKSLPTLSDLLCGRIKGRDSDSQITGFVNNIGLGAQFAAVGAKVYAAAKAKGLGREVPLDWFTQDVHPPPLPDLWLIPKASPVRRLCRRFFPRQSIQ